MTRKFVLLNLVIWLVDREKVIIIQQKTISNNLPKKVESFIRRNLFSYFIKNFPSENQVNLNEMSSHNACESSFHWFL